MNITIHDCDKALRAAHWCAENLADSAWDISLNGPADARIYRFAFSNEQDFLLFSLNIL